MSTAHDMSQQQGQGVEAKVATLEGQLALLSQAVSLSNNNMTSAMGAMQADLREVSRTVQTIRTEQHEMRSHSEGLQRLGNAIEKLSEKFERYEADNKARDEAINTFKGGVKVLWAVVLIMGSLASAYVLNEFDHQDERATRFEQATENRLDRLESKQ